MKYVIFTFLVSFLVVSCGPPTELQGKWMKNITISNCACKLSYKKLLAGLKKPLYKCRVTILNKTKVKFDTGTDITWKALSGTGAEVLTVSSDIEEFLVPGKRVTWKHTEDTLVEDKEIKNRVRKVKCEISDLSEAID